MEANPNMNLERKGKSSAIAWNSLKTRARHSQGSTDPVKEHRDERCSSLESSSGQSSLLLEEGKKAEIEEDSATEREDDEFNPHEEGELEK